MSLEQFEINGIKFVSAPEIHKGQCEGCVFDNGTEHDELCYDIRVPTCQGNIFIKEPNE